MINYYDILLIGGVFTSFLTSILLFKSGGSQKHANRLLGVVIFGWGWYVFLYLLIVTGWLAYIPGIYRIGSPVYYLIPACNYLYTRSVLLDETRFRKYDWLHFLPATLHAMELLPYYLSGPQEKQMVANAIAGNFSLAYQRGDGLIPAFWHFQLRWILGVIYLIFQWRLLYQILQKDNLKEFRTVTNWLITFAVFCTVVYAGLGSMSVFAWLNLESGKSPLDSGRSIPRLMQVAGFMALSIYLFFKPEILYGVPRGTGKLAPLDIEPEMTKKPDSETALVMEDTQQVDKSPDREIPFNPELIESYAEQVGKYIIDEEAFRQPGYTINELAKALKMPIHHLSYILNHYYKQRFTDFINSYRVDYLKKRLDNGDWRSFSLEGLARDAGFSSRSTFFAAFKKKTGITPSTYVQQNEMVNFDR
ncbi:helix-turn-helix- domain containing protein AraC type [Pseudopedobacter saltans DSM 12145]|uniref:Helix-turn-helix-domain containing protein AraC type n=1 Tax=Pseudopedobacter saltans (strain ATCC 51119 / DSM 12145 / JCM 21818 / CCUG 39354 / LMG 10337 / NBRC 100064 / NCIMB 13643) TaxID=762903 RepID=F0SAG0_PSESL|nr:helix-turn-helix domain-containing protein [Pseudopedobacter saltans]ADY52580.1 helix-turn-helix- domain containing protein AraC type [Pseudopedobacter saltans DSM 12145]